MKRFVSLFISLFIFCGFVLSVESKFVIVIDPGHGGKDGGAVRGSYKEKDINLGVAKALGALIEANHKDVKVVYTRKTDVFVDLDKRSQIANKAKANLFISIHTNSTAAKTTTVSGADTYILGLARSRENLEVAKRENSVILLEDDYTSKYEGFDPTSTESYIIFEFMTNKFMEQSLQFADLVQQNFKSVAKRTDRGVRQAGFLVLRKSGMPSVLIELGFINNPTEAKFLSSRSGQKSMASAIYAGFRGYKRDYDKKLGRFVPSTKDDNIVDIQNDIDLDENVVAEDINTSSSSNDNSTEAPKENLSATGNSSSTKKVNSNQIEYRVQFFVSPKKLSANSSVFKGLSPVNYYKDGNSYKYTYGSETNLTEIAKVQASVRRKFKDAFVVKFRNGERIK